jgi:hypothetical protein
MKAQYSDTLTVVGAQTFTNDHERPPINIGGNIIIHPVTAAAVIVCRRREILLLTFNGFHNRSFLARFRIMLTMKTINKALQQPRTIHTRVNILSST